MDAPQVNCIQLPKIHEQHAHQPAPPCIQVGSIQEQEGPGTFRYAALAACSYKNSYMCAIQKLGSVLISGRLVTTVYRNV